MGIVTQNANHDNQRQGKRNQNKLQKRAMQDGTKEKDTPELGKVSKAPILVIITQIPRSRDTSVSPEPTLLQRSSRD